MKHLIYILGLGLMISACGDKSSSSSTKSDLNNERDSISYFLGVTIGTDMKQGGTTDFDFDLMRNGMVDAATKDSININPQQIQMYVMSYFEKQDRLKIENEISEVESWVKENRNMDEVKRGNEGFFYRVIEEGTGEKPGVQNDVTVHYTGKLFDGTVFDSSIPKGEPVTFPLARVIRGWTYGVQLMSVGSKYEFFIPANLGYGPGTGPSGTLPPNSHLVFEVELLDIVQAGEAE
ncbi:MAG: FKBP-type peptidyl-prolyl cis-trans isomerase [Bacteroidia bacterium]